MAVLVPVLRAVLAEPFTSIGSGIGGPGWLVAGVGVARTLRELGTMVDANPSADVTQLGNYDATGDGTFTSAVITAVYSGVFEGGGYEISNLRIVNTATGAAVADTMFTQIDTGGVVQNLNFVHAYVSGNGAYTSAFCALLQGTADNVNVDATIYNNGVSSKLATAVSYVQAGGEYKNSVCTGRVTALNTGDYHGGAVALAYGKITNVGSSVTTDSSAVTPGFGSWNGCLVGVIGNTVGNSPDSHDTALVSGCWSMGTARGPTAASAQNYVGAFVGNALDCVVEDCYAGGNVFGASNCAGFAGRVQGGRLRRCSTTATVTGTSNKTANFAGQIDKICAVSPTSTTIGTGSKLFSNVFQATLTGGATAVAYAFSVGVEVRVYSLADPTKYMQGLVTASTFGTPSDVTIDVATTNGSGTFTDWVLKPTYANASHCWSSGDASGVGSCGMFGYISTFATLDHIFNFGNVISTGKPYAGGLAGQCQGTIDQGYAFGGLSSAGSGGGVVGNQNVGSVYTNCYWSTTNGPATRGSGTVLSPTGITGKTTAQLLAALPAGFDAAWAQTALAGGLPYFSDTRVPDAPVVVPPIAAKQFIVVAPATTVTLPADWNPTGAIVEAWGPGGNGADGTTATGGRGGGSGAWSKLTNPGGAPNDVVACQIGTGGSVLPTWYISPTTLNAQPGTNASTIASGQGGVAASGFGTTKRGGAAGGVNNNSGPGGGGAGAAGPDTNGLAGGAGAGSAAFVGGGGGGGQSGGTAGSAGSAAGGGKAGDAADGTVGPSGSTNIAVDGADGFPGTGGAGGYASPAGGSSGGDGGNGNVFLGGTTAGQGGGGGGGAGLAATPQGGNGGNGGGWGGAGGGGGRGVIPGAKGLGADGGLLFTYTPLA